MAVHFTFKPYAVQNRVFCILAMIIVMLFSSLIASSHAHALELKDIKDGSDLSVVGRYPGSFLTAATYQEYDEANFPLSGNTYEAPTEYDRLEASGKRSVLVYTLPESETSVLKVYRAIQSGLRKAGFSQRFACESRKENCGWDFTYYAIKHHELTYNTYYKYKLEDITGFSEFYISVGELEKEDKQYYLMVVVGRSSRRSYIQYAYDLVEADVLEEKELNEPLTQAQLASELSESGRVVLDGLFFANDSVELTNESEQSLRTIAEFLQSQSTKKYYVVGHTDNKGGYQYNARLSRGRADAVVNALVERFSISKNRLRGAGVSFLSPTESNTTAGQRKKNRRVELVEVEEF